MAISPFIPVPSTEILERLPGKIPVTQVPENVDIEAGVKTILSSLLIRDSSQDQTCFTEDALWRDFYALTGTIRTFYFKNVPQQWSLLSKSHDVSAVEIIAGSSSIRKIGSEASYLECAIRFTTSNPETECSGFLSLVPSPTGSGWKVWVLRTFLEQLPSHGNGDVLAPIAELGSRVSNGVSSPTTSSEATNSYTAPKNGAEERNHAPDHFFAVVIGGEQSGLSTGGRLKALGVPYVVLESNKEVGDTWRSRYESARLYTIREFAHLPFERTFGPSYPEYLGKEHLADGHRDWARRYGINIWKSTKVETGQNGTTQYVTAKHVVIASGAGSQTPVVPILDNKELFRGQSLHSVDYISADNWKGKVGIVVGTANTGHDVADDMCEAGMQVTMVQRNRTYVLPVEYIEEGYHQIYNAKIPIEISDKILYSNPVSIDRILGGITFHAKARAESERWASLERAGFKVDPYGDIQEALNIRLGGHYIDVGTSAKISNGLIKVKSDAAVVAFTEHGLAFSDGTTLDADVIVFATGFIGNLRNHVERTFGKDLADRAGDSFGLNEEGEVLGAFKPLKLAQGKLSIEEVDIPIPGENEVLVRVKAVALNQYDWKILYGRDLTEPTVLGCDFAGVAEAIGSNVTSVKKGDRVAGWVQGGNILRPKDGAFGELIVAPAHVMLHLPETISYESGAALPVPVFTAGICLFHTMALPGYKTTKQPEDDVPVVLIYGGATSIGLMQIQMAKLWWLKAMELTWSLTIKSPTVHKRYLMPQTNV
ncbi:uncharacterized protein PV06_11070 [Exophiala oligosperma]|uniref:Enoyl reductase (ER) domain-containing protein n=1 Tax=Exophiala oligosperma TaxID=215243 RepID=A0A0D2DM19_9EURO|nr:uncharacterized protein PV06_11070 [Exophiala oligosperma]KIW36784.1 hypothetical protein PV06_11070 [Exophiala oligosperma]